MFVEDLYIDATVDQGGNMVNASRNMGVPVLICTGHRLSSGIGWGLDTNGSYNPGAEEGKKGTCKNPALRKIMSTMTACAGLFSHAPCNSDAFKGVQTDVCEMGKALEVLHRNDTRYIAGFVDSHA